MSNEGWPALALRESAWSLIRSSHHVADFLRGYAGSRVYLSFAAFGRGPKAAWTTKDCISLEEACPTKAGPLWLCEKVLGLIYGAHHVADFFRGYAGSRVYLSFAAFGRGPKAAWTTKDCISLEEACPTKA